MAVAEGLTNLAAAHVGESYPISERLGREVLSLPMSADLQPANQKSIISAIGEALRATA